MPKKKAEIEIPEEKPLLKSGIATLLGRSNVGKSTLINSLIGTKIAAVTDKPQTTRNIIHGVLNTPEGQVVFIDTPGIFKEKHTLLSQKLMKSAHEALQDINLVVYVVDPTKAIQAEERFILSLIRHLDIPKIMVLNKSDLPKPEKKYLDDYLQLSEEFTAVFELSALFNRHVQPFVRRIMELLPIGEPLYPPNQITNIGRDFWMSEVIREKIFMALRKEVPYTTHVEIESVEDKPDVIVIQANVFTLDKRYKKMIIGEGGRAIKEIGIAARKELEVALNKKVFLQLEVETDKRWEERL